MESVDLSVIIPTHRRRDMLADHLARLRALPGPAREIIVIDDASSDGTAELLRDAFPDVRVLRNDAPRGFDAVPDAIAMARGRLIMQLDDDAYPAPGTLEKVLEHFDRRGPKLGLVALPFVEPGSGRRIQTTYLPTLPQGQAYGPTPGFLAGAVVLRREAASSIPPSPPGYFMYQTEPPALIEYLDAGWEADFLATAPLYHVWAGRGRKMSANSAFLPFRNEIVTIKRYYRGWRRLEMMVGCYLAGFVHLSATGHPGKWGKALKEAERMLSRLPPKRVRTDILERVYPCFAGTTLATIFSWINIRRAAWLLGLIPVDRIG